MDRAVLEAFDRPVFAIVGEVDSLAPVAELKGIISALPRGKLVVIPEADHFFGVGLRTISAEISNWLDE